MGKILAPSPRTVGRIELAEHVMLLGFPGGSGKLLAHWLLLLLLLSHFSRVRLYDPIDGSLPGSPVSGILQAKTLEWVAISFSNA